jgi:hypothetical protein
MRAEIAQVAMHEAFTHSGFSFEDFVSNLLSFYGHVKGYNQSQIRGMCGGFSNREERLRVARSVLTAMNNSGISQDRIKSSSWTYAYLFNDLCSECQLRDRNRGFRLLPDEFRSIHSPAPGDFFPNDPNSPRQQRLDHAASVGVIA